MWKLKDEAEGGTRAQNAKKMRELLENCRDVAPGTREFEVGLAAPGEESTYDVVLVSTFDDQTALDAYQVHPEHEKAKAFIGKVRESRQCVDYVI
ncbi:Dabb family protein [Pararobbsia silviterrae]|uniref:Dabb family protein n=2 Tax=Pararobbsia silviterrae TaxID=1792498 RepID=A0A494XW10_9BURK|nr:Dabb family protein [Pararobbsia silviterrae]